MGKEKTMLVKDFKERIMGLPDNAELIFGTGGLSFHQVKPRGGNLYQIEFNEVYKITHE